MFLTRAEHRGRITFLDLLEVLFFMQTRMLLGCFAETVYGCLMDNLGFKDLAPLAPLAPLALFYKSAFQILCPQLLLVSGGLPPKVEILAFPIEIHFPLI